MKNFLYKTISKSYQYQINQINKFLIYVLQFQLMEKYFYSQTERSEAAGTSYQVLNTVDYYLDQLREISLAVKRVWLQTMAFENSHFSDLLIHTLSQSAARNVDVRLALDAYTDYVFANTFNHLPLFSKIEHQHKLKMRQLLAGSLQNLTSFSQLKITNIPTGVMKHLPLSGVMGRDHKKVTLVDDTVYLGGVNQTPLDAKRVDMMIKIRNSAIVAALEQLFIETLADLPQTDRLIQCDFNTSILVDGGKRGESITMDCAQELIEAEKEEIILISPFIPRGRLRQSLNQAAKNGVVTKIITTAKSHSAGFTPLISQIVHNFAQAKPIFRIYGYPSTIHAKALICGQKIAICGSHNFDDMFVSLGTEEVSLITRQPDIILQLCNYANSLLGECSLS